MRAANILTGIAVALWFGALVVGRALVGGAIAQGVGGLPNAGQIDLYLIGPALVVAALLVFAWVTNGLCRWFTPLALLSTASIVALVPYLMVFGGGV